MGVPIFVLEYLGDGGDEDAFSIRVRPPESWRQGPVRRRLLRAFVKAYDSFCVEELELVSKEGIVVRRRATLETVDEHLRVRRRREGRHFYVGAAWQLVVASGPIFSEESFWRSRGRENANISPRERSARIALDRDPSSCQAASHLVEMLVEERRWAAAVDEVVENEDLLLQVETGRIAAGRAFFNAGFEKEATKRFGVEDKDHRQYLRQAVDMILSGDCRLLREARNELSEAARHHPDDPRPSVWDARCRAMENRLFDKDLRPLESSGDEASLLKRIDELLPESGFAETAALVALRARIENDRERLWREKKHRDRLRKFGDDYHFPSDDKMKPNQRADEEHHPAERTPYEILGISREATAKEIRTAYRRKALETHPDRASEEPEASAERFREVHEAQTKLTDPGMKARVDAELHRPPIRKEIVVNSLRPRPSSTLWD